MKCQRCHHPRTRHYSANSDLSPTTVDSCRCCDGMQFLPSSLAGLLRTAWTMKWCLLRHLNSVRVNLAWTECSCSACGIERRPFYY